MFVQSCSSSSIRIQPSISDISSHPLQCKAPITTNQSLQTIGLQLWSCGVHRDCLSLHGVQALVPRKPEHPSPNSWGDFVWEGLSEIEEMERIKAAISRIMGIPETGAPTKKSITFECLCNILARSNSGSCERSFLEYHQLLLLC